MPGRRRTTTASVCFVVVLAAVAATEAIASLALASVAWHSAKRVCVRALHLWVARYAERWQRGRSLTTSLSANTQKTRKKTC